LLVPGNTTTPATYDYTWWLTYFRDPAGWTADKVYGVLSVLSFHSYPVMALMIACLSFTGAWVLLRTFVSMYPQLTNQFAWSILFVPSIFFWGSGVLKDSITFACIGWVTYTTYQIFFKRRKIIGNSIVLLFTAYIALKIKAYIIISFLPATVLWIFLTYRSRIGNQFLRVASGPMMLLIALGCGFLMVRTMGKEFEQFSLNEVIATSERFQQWHGYLAETDHASGYSLGTMTGTWQNVLSKLPLAVNVTLFRPYLWEATNPMMLVAAIESIFMLGFTIYILYKNGIIRTITSIITNPNVFFCFFFAILFAFAVGFTSYNFGALVRYKIPCIPFYLGGLIILNHLTAIDREKRLLEKEELRKRTRPLGGKIPKHAPLTSLLNPEAR
jgi:hypothetical protein